MEYNNKFIEDNSLDDKSKEIEKIAKNCYKNIETFYGRFYTDKMSLSTKIFMLSFAVIFTAAVLFLFLPMSFKAQIPWLVTGFFLTISVIFSVVIVKIIFFNVDDNYMFYYKIGDKVITIYWDKYHKDHIIINFGQGKRFIYDYKRQQWSKYSYELVGKNIYFNYITDKLSIKEKKDATIIRAHNFKRPKNMISSNVSAELKLSNDIPIYIKYYLLRTRKNPNFVGRETNPTAPYEVLNLRVEFIEINCKMQIEVPKSLIAYCKKKSIAPPEENEFLRYV